MGGSSWYTGPSLSLRVPGPTCSHARCCCCLQVAKTYPVENNVGKEGWQVEVVAELRLPHHILVRLWEAAGVKGFAGQSQASIQPRWLGCAL